ncbi:hypothetical protein AVEN_13856-1, partial [Araneus ventricosus]
HLILSRSLLGRFNLKIFLVSIHQFPIPEGKSGQQAAEILQKRLETIGAVKTGTFCVECETYYAAPHIS